MTGLKYPTLEDLVSIIRKIPNDAIDFPLFGSIVEI
jgi:hypothetical protein